MKRILVFTAMLVVVTSCFAYYGDYSSSSSSEWLTFISIITVIGGILEIILFFKIWGMTNDIKALKKDHFNETVFESNADIARFLRKNLVMGNVDNVKRILFQEFIYNVEIAYEQLALYSYEKPKQFIRPYIESLQKQLDKIGEELPVYIQRMETFGDYFDLFTKEDLRIDKEKK